MYFLFICSLTLPYIATTLNTSKQISFIELPNTDNLSFCVYLELHQIVLSSCSDQKPRNNVCANLF